MQINNKIFPCVLHSRFAFSRKFPTGWCGTHSVPVHVESFGYASSRDIEARVRVGVRQSWEGRHPLHLPPAELLQRNRTVLQQGRSHQVPQRSANVDTYLLAEIVNSNGMQWYIYSACLGTPSSVGHPSGKRGCWTERQSWRTRWFWSKTQAADGTFWILSAITTKVRATNAIMLISL